MILFVSISAIKHKHGRFRAHCLSFVRNIESPSFYCLGRRSFKRGSKRVLALIKLSLISAFLISVGSFLVTLPLSNIKKAFKAINCVSEAV